MVAAMRNARRSIIPVMSLAGGDDSCKGMWWVGEGIERGRYQATKATSTAPATMPRMASIATSTLLHMGKTKPIFVGLVFLLAGFPKAWSDLVSHYLHEPFGDCIGVKLTCTSAVDKPVHEIPARLREC